MSLFASFCLVASVSDRNFFSQTKKGGKKWQEDVNFRKLGKTSLKAGNIYQYSD